MKKLLLLLSLIFITTHSMPSKKKSPSWKDEKEQRIKSSLLHILNTRISSEVAQFSLARIKTAADKLVKHLNSTEQKNTQNERDFEDAITALTHNTQIYRLHSGNSLIPPLPVELAEFMPAQEIKDFTII